MLILPDTTIIKKRIPRQQLYEEMSCTPALKKVFKEQVQDIWWINKLEEATTKIATGIHVSEIQVFEVHLAGNTVAMEILRQIDRCIPPTISSFCWSMTAGIRQSWHTRKSVSTVPS